MGLVIDSIAYTLTPAQRAAASVIESEFAAAGFSSQVAAAAIVNAWAESTLNPAAHLKTEREDSAGLFQLNVNGAGHDMPKGSKYPKGDSRFDPTLNVRRFIREITSTTPGRRFMADVRQSPRDLAYIAGRMCYHIERPQDKAVKAMAREQFAQRMFPRGVLVPAPVIVPAVSEQRPRFAPQKTTGGRPAAGWWFLIVAPLVMISSLAARDWYDTRGDG